ncbi:MAG: hypothetical protein EA402_09835 [Planctomycetota bacterium]|nr:MAG: hypothetical protein EA402_09835 [Planctomycetota bacterium]
MSSSNDDIQAFAREFQQAAGEGGFNPLSLFTGEPRFHSLFLAPFSPSMQDARESFLKDGSGPLSGLVQQFSQSGLSPVEAAERARQMLSAAQGMCVVVLQDDQGLSTIPQLFFGHLESAYQESVRQLCGESLAADPALEKALKQLAQAAQAGAQGYQLYAAVDSHGNARDYWSELGAALLAGLDEGIFLGAGNRLADLAHWVQLALCGLSDSGKRLEGDELVTVIRCQVLAGNIPAAIISSNLLLEGFEPEDEELLHLLEQISQHAIRLGRPEAAIDFLERQSSAINAILGGCYEWELLRFKALAAAGSDEGRMLAQAEALMRADRKSFRHDLNREPLWQVTSADPGACLSVHQAAEVLDRSINFVAKRLEAGTIPFAQTGEERRIPEAALKAWKAIQDTYRLID